MSKEDTTSNIDRRRFIKSTAAIGAAGLFAGCVGTDPDDTSGGGGTFRIATSDEVETFDPRMNQMVWYSTAAHYLFDSLFMLEPDGSGTVPHLADGELEEVDETTFVADIRDDVSFHNGDQLTAEDVAYSLNWVRNPDNDSPNLSNVEFIDEAEATGEFEVTLHLDYQFALMEQELATMNAAIVPMDVAEEMGQEEFAQNPIGSGPFELVNHDPSASVELEAYDDYFLGEPALDGLEYRIIPEAEVGFVELADGTIHQSSVTDALVDEAESNDAVETHQLDTFNFQGLIINCLEGPFEDVRAREAVQYLVDYDELLTGAVGDLGGRSVAHMPQGVVDAWDFPADEWREQYYPEQDHDRARELFEAAGLDTDFEVDIVTLSGEAMRGRATVLQHEFEEVGIDANVREVSDGEWLDSLDNGTFDINTYGWGGGDDPDGYYYRMFRDLTNDDGGMNDDVVGHSSIGYLYEGARSRGDDDLLEDLERFDELVRAARETTDREERYEYYVEAVEILMPLYPVIGVYSAEGVTGVHTDVQGYQPTEFGEQEVFNHWQEARIDD
ncbi:family 5 extracellular solute-binding protein [Natrialba hulunbeirensis JCM 10989]|uniref:Family 5 extracellular solute-binding protein n=1 Tax=Natrialba hulunbeirensis JCM 10989 TaxID=1227493 RepID=M0A345_9EURY|nr:ABC transporter substrate-binding protein [Natrialba hulunbeirensis]ELY92292.1 family 5 extracellular solute-binding protein [Natrialba hulunbeirensis JCM 10989]